MCLFKNYSLFYSFKKFNRLTLFSGVKKGQNLEYLWIMNGRRTKGENVKCNCYFILLINNFVDCCEAGVKYHCKVRIFKYHWFPLHLSIRLSVPTTDAFIVTFMFTRISTLLTFPCPWKILSCTEINHLTNSKMSIPSELWKNSKNITFWDNCYI